MEGIFAFFLESSFLGILLYRREPFQSIRSMARDLDALSRLMAVRLFHHRDQCLDATSRRAIHSLEDGRVFVNSLTGLLTNPWIFWQYAHTMTASVVTASFVMAAVGALYSLLGLYVTHAKTFVQTGVVAGAIACALMIFPTGDGNAKQVFAHQPIKGAAFEGLFRTERGAGLILVGQPNMETLTIDNPVGDSQVAKFSRLRGNVG